MKKFEDYFEFLKWTYVGFILQSFCNCPKGPKVVPNFFGTFWECVKQCAFGSVHPPVLGNVCNQRWSCVNHCWLSIESSSFQSTPILLLLSLKRMAFNLTMVGHIVWKSMYFLHFDLSISFVWHLKIMDSYCLTYDVVDIWNSRYQYNIEIVKMQL